ncbi:aminotransferase class IV [Candidatus Microgenomates bacterium]|nr:aminotransferase class IV [Candidatus Microgenomates bacterium]
MFCYFNDKIVPLEEIKISPYDLGFLRGFGVFDFLRTYGGKPFRLADHIKRFRASANITKLPVPYSDGKIMELTEELLEKNGRPECCIRIMLSGGVEPKLTAPTFLILIEPLHTFPSECYTKGIKVATINEHRLYPTAKTTCYLPALKAQQELKNENPFEVIYAPDGNVLEASTANIFIVKNGKLITPKDGILLGITRQVVLELSVETKHASSLQATESVIVLQELYTANECFLTASNKEIMPVTEIDGRKIGDGQVGKITKEVMKRFTEYTGVAIV